MDLFKNLWVALSGYKTAIGFGLGVMLLAFGWFGVDLTPSDPNTLIPSFAWEIVGVVVGVGFIDKLKKIEQASTKK